MPSVQMGPSAHWFRILYFLIPYSWQHSSALCLAVFLFSLVATSTFPVPLIWSCQ